MQADLIFTGGPVYTADQARRRLVAAASGGPAASAVAVAGGRILAVAAAGDQQVRDWTGPATEVIDLRGRALLPGFQDAHVHPAFAGVTMVCCNLIGAASLDEALTRIRSYADSRPGQAWIAGPAGGWNGSPAGRQAAACSTR